MQKRWVLTVCWQRGMPTLLALADNLRSCTKRLPLLLQVARSLEKKVHELLEASVMLVRDGNTQQGE